MLRKRTKSEDGHYMTLRLNLKLQYLGQCSIGERTKKKSMGQNSELKIVPHKYNL